MSSMFAWGWDGTDWQKISVDSDGHLQVDFAATPTVSSRLYGYDGVNWQELLVESNLLKNLRVKLYDGANGMVLEPSDAGLSGSQYSLLVASCVYGWTGTDWAAIHRAYGLVDDLSPVYSSLFTISYLHGFNGSKWDRIRCSAAMSLMTKEETSNPTTSGPITASKLVHNGPCHIYAITVNKSDATAVIVQLKDGLNDTANVVWEVRVTGLNAWPKNFWPWLVNSKGLYVDITGNVHSVIIELGD